MLTPAQIRDALWRDIAAQCSGQRLRVYRALLLHGPATTLGLAAVSDISPWSVRPRVCELVQLGLARCVGRIDREGVYQAIPLAEAETAHAYRRAGGDQMLMPF